MLPVKIIKWWFEESKCTEYLCAYLCLPEKMAGVYILNKNPKTLSQRILLGNARHYCSAVRKSEYECAKSQHTGWPPVKQACKIPKCKNTKINDINATRYWSNKTECADKIQKLITKMQQDIDQIRLMMQIKYRNTQIHKYKLQKYWNKWWRCNRILIK